MVVPTADDIPDDGMGDDVTDYQAGYYGYEDSNWSEYDYNNTYYDYYYPDGGNSSSTWDMNFTDVIHQLEMFPEYYCHVNFTVFHQYPPTGEYYY